MASGFINTFSNQGKLTANPPSVLKAGKVSVVKGANTVTGTGTQFTTDFIVGSLIVIGGQTLTVASISNDTTMTVTPLTVATINNGYYYGASPYFQVEDCLGNNYMEVNEKGCIQGPRYTLAVVDFAHSGATLTAGVTDVILDRTGGNIVVTVPAADKVHGRKINFYVKPLLSSNNNTVRVKDGGNSNSDILTAQDVDNNFAIFFDSVSGTWLQTVG